MDADALALTPAEHLVLADAYQRARQAADEAQRRAMELQVAMDTVIRLRGLNPGRYQATWNGQVVVVREKAAADDGVQP